MSFRSTLTRQFGSLTSLRLAPHWTGAAVAAGLVVVAGVGYGGCDNNNVNCNADGQCEICNAYGCHPANGMGGSGGSGGGQQVSTGGTGGTGGATTTSSSSGMTGGGGTGGAAPCDPKDATCPCDATGQCSDGKTCVNGLCIDGCNFTYQCPTGKVCDDGACVPGCATAADCGAGYACTDGVCVLDPNNPACSSTDPCPSGQVCTSGVCATGCATNSDCPTGDVCDGATHTCISDPSTQSECSAAKPCTSPEVCEADGYCHYPCTTLLECQHIDNRFVACAQGFCQTDDEVNPQCSLTKPCPPGQNCISSKCQ